jgi:hypothetical protein
MEADVILLEDSDEVRLWEDFQFVGKTYSSSLNTGIGIGYR